ncbi:MAG: efflux RND transporter periplasmic adaptor subunit [Burkholderiales bacterium]|nr:efflux RND transporter periplasmic adaptor subunit [Burkholderiales bacterium]
MAKKQLVLIAIVIAATAVLGGWILTFDKTSPKQAAEGAKPTLIAGKEAGMAAEPRKGPHGGKYFSAGDFALEVTIFETGVPPQFRVYLYEDDKPLAPSATNVGITLSRLGAPPQVFRLAAEGDYLRGDQIVEEPHSFDVAVTAKRNGQSHQWAYSQVEARVAMTDAALKGADVEIKTAGPATIKNVLQLPGEIQFNQDGLVHVVPRVSGIVTASPVASGQRIKKNDLLAVLDSQALADMRSDFSATQKRLALARTTHGREKKLWQEKISAEQDYLLAKQALSEAEIAFAAASQKLRVFGVSPKGSSDQLARFEIRAPIDGVVVEKDIALGEAIKDDANIFTIADLTTVWAEITVYPKDLNTIKIGQQVTIKATAFQAEAVGEVSYIGSLVGEQTRTAKARVTLPNPDGVWRPGLFVRVELTSDEAQVPVAVAVDAIQTVRDWSVVFGRYGEFLEARPLELGRSDGKMVEVVEGLAAGVQYAAGNSFAIKAELGKSGATHDH